jgi:hypothetical protein
MKGQTFSISVQATSGKSFTAGFGIGCKINVDAASPSNELFPPKPRQRLPRHPASPLSPYAVTTPRFRWLRARLTQKNHLHALSLQRIAQPRHRPAPGQKENPPFWALCELPPAADIWVPFETGWAAKAKWLPAHVLVLYAEIYPGVRDPLPDEIKDRGQVRTMWQWACDLDRDNLLWREFCRPIEVETGRL